MTEPDFIRTARAAYDAMSTDCGDGFRVEPAAKPLERAMLTAFAELVTAGDGGPLVALSAGAGLEVRARLVREPDEAVE